MYHFVINPKSRSGMGTIIWKKVQAKLDELNISYTYHYTKYNNHATNIAKELCENYQGIKNIVVLGGDGTVNEVVNGIKDFREVVLGYIPSGSSNDLARSLKLPKDPIECLQHILKPTKFQYVDIGTLIIKDSGEERAFVVSSGVGFDASICKETFHSTLKLLLNKFRLGKLTYIVIALKQLLSCDFFNGDITIDGRYENTYHNILLITSMIHRYEGGGMLLSPKANPYDGKFSVCIVYGLSKLRLFVLLPTLLFGKHIYFKGVETFNCKTLDIHLKESTNVHVDGEYPGLYRDYSLVCSEKQLRFIL